MPNNNFYFPPNLDPQTYAWLGCIVGSACATQLNALEQNTLGNWLILVGQFLETTAGQQQLLEDRFPSQNSNNFSNNCNNYKNEIDFLIDAVSKLQQELENLKNHDTK